MPVPRTPACTGPGPCSARHRRSHPHTATGTERTQGDPITLKVNKLMSAKNLPFEYYSLPYCRPSSIVSSAENLGEVLRGDRILNSPYTVRPRAWW